ncbi:MAG TPA: K(+)-transporting ATPase subunit F [Phycisphaerales bacterium]|nr:K(+)-transporting ATPase subunit F [Phycisphaerales bacterium]
MTPQTVIYTLAAVVAAALLIYLLIALLKPEWFQ